MFIFPSATIYIEIRVEIPTPDFSFVNTFTSLFSYSCFVAHDPSALTDISETGKCDNVTVCAYALQEWVVLGQVDVEKLIEKHLNSVQDWERNFKALKVRGKDSERLPRYSEACQTC